MVVPAVGVVVGDDDGGGFPVPAVLQPVDGVDQEPLLVQRRGVAGMSVLVRRGLEEADPGHVPVVHRTPEVGEVVLMIGLVGFADHVR